MIQKVERRQPLGDLTGEGKKNYNWLCRHPWEPNAEASGSADESPLKRAVGACFSTLPSAKTADTTVRGKVKVWIRRRFSKPGRAQTLAGA